MFLVGYSQSSKTEWRLCEGAEVLLRFESPPLEADHLRQGEMVNMFRPVVLPGGHVKPEKIYLCDSSFGDNKYVNKVNGALVQLNPRLNIHLSSPLQVAPALLHKADGVFLWRGDTWMAARFVKGVVTAQFELQPENWHSFPWKEPTGTLERKNALKLVDELLKGIEALGPITPGEPLDIFGQVSPWQYKLIRDVLHDHDMRAGLVIRNFMPLMMAHYAKEGAGTDHSFPGF